MTDRIQERIDALTRTTRMQILKPRYNFKLKSKVLARQHVTADGEVTLEEIIMSTEEDCV